jgi:hypothetical protein
VRVISPAAMAACRAKGRCENCGKPGAVDCHHLHSRGIGGGTRIDVPELLMALDRQCHDLAAVLGNTLLEKVAAREKTTVELLTEFRWRIIREPKKASDEEAEAFLAELRLELFPKKGRAK